MNSDVDFDAVRLASNILRGISSDKVWKVVNIAKDSREKFDIDGYTAIQETYGYEFNDSVGILEKNNIIESKMSGWWYVGVTRTDSYWAKQIYPNLTILDDLWWKTQEKKYLKDGEMLEYYFEERPTSNQIDCQGPRVSGQFSILVNVEALKGYVNKNRQVLLTNNRLNHNTTSTEVWHKDFDFNRKKNSLLLPPYGECKFSKKNNPNGGEQNQRAFLVEIVFQAGEGGINANTIRKRFKENKMNAPDNREIDAMKAALDKRFQKEFNGAKVTLKNVGSNSAKIIKLSVVPLQKT